MRCGFVEWSEDLTPSSNEWDAFRARIEVNRPDVLITNEMPFGPWLASKADFEEEAARRSVLLHEAGTEALMALALPAIISSRPVFAGDRLFNEAFILQDGRSVVLHRKQYFPSEEGWFESDWFHGDDSGFVVHEVLGMKVGVLLCTELMFNEHARAYGRAGADLIAVPRATGHSYQKWVTAGAMAAIVSGSYVISSNRIGQSDHSPLFGGRGLAFAPDGILIGETSIETSLAVVELDVIASRNQKKAYPCYVTELQN